jgi:hypothetical protein
MSSVRYWKVIAKVGVVVLAAGALNVSVHAQNAYQGKFTLPFETYWGGATLPAGDYTFALPTESSPYILYIHGSNANAIVRPVTTEDVSGSGHAQLNLADAAALHVVTEFEAPELGFTFIFSAPTSKHMRGKEIGHNTNQSEAGARVSENKVSIAVQTNGR